jgi:hypothetical protein
MSNNFKQIIPGTVPLATDVDQLRQAFSGIADVGPLTLCAPQSIPIVASVGASGVGNLNGTYYYKIVLVTGFQQSDGSFYVNGFASSVDSAKLTVANGQCSLTNIPIGTAGTIGRAIYRTIAGGTVGLEKFAFVIWDNTTTSFLDNVLDGNLGTGMPNSSTLPASYGTAIPSTPSATNTTGTSFAQQTPIVPTFLNGWSSYGYTYEVFHYWMDTSGYVRIQGSVSSGTTNTAIFRLPVGYAPLNDEFFACDANASYGSVDIIGVNSGANAGYVVGNYGGTRLGINVVFRVGV